ncbi:uncharacterized protein LOC115899270 [Rhinopithecus roxellana]|uniref:uncharacterized protein LOC115899270 n=1 Tax=Rhinopithecus roxellana TaxID=61622 RepID=UPI0012375E1C|nr:uncharacterized protein LOC115899270 [Rhinopithecus roxellana]
MPETSSPHTTPLLIPQPSSGSASVQKPPWGRQTQGCDPGRGSTVPRVTRPSPLPRYLGQGAIPGRGSGRRTESDWSYARGFLSCPSLSQEREPAPGGRQAPAPADAPSPLAEVAGRRLAMSGPLLPAWMSPQTRRNNRIPDLSRVPCMDTAVSTFLCSWDCHQALRAGTPAVPILQRGKWAQGDRAARRVQRQDSNPGLLPCLGLWQVGLDQVEGVRWKLEEPLWAREGPR